jgi:hypothetical protein
MFIQFLAVEILRGIILLHSLEPRHAAILEVRWNALFLVFPIAN